MSNYIRESMEAYQARKAMSAGMAWRMVTECPLLAWHHSPFNPGYEPQTARHFDVGTAAHLAILEPDEVDRRVVQLDCDNYRTAAARLIRDEVYEIGKTPLLAPDADLVIRMCGVIKSQCDLFQDGAAEVTYVWEWDGVPCKARVDYIANRRPRGMLLIDLKTASSSSPVAFRRAMLRDGHHLRAAWYLDGYAHSVATDDKVSYRYVVVSKDEPHIVSEFEVGPRSLEWGRRLYRKAIEMFPKYMKSGVWPGYVETATPVELPAHAEYALADMEAEGAL